MRLKPFRTGIHTIEEVRQTLIEMATHHPEWAISAVKTGAYVALVGECVRCNPTGGAFAVTLPKAALWNQGRLVWIKNVSASANVITITPATGDTIDGAASQTLAVGRSRLVLVSDGVSDWMIESST